MPCGICGRDQTWHGSQEPNARPGTYLMEMGCHQGVRMDDDEYHEGWQSDTIYPPCPHNPLCCKACGGDGQSRSSKSKSDDCDGCRGIGWLHGQPKWPATA